MQFVPFIVHPDIQVHVLGAVHSIFAPHDGVHIANESINI